MSKCLVAHRDVVGAVEYSPEKEQGAGKPCASACEPPELKRLSPASWLRSLPPAAVCGSSPAKCGRLTQTHTLPSRLRYHIFGSLTERKDVQGNSTQLPHRCFCFTFTPRSLWLEATGGSSLLPVETFFSRRAPPRLGM